MTCTVSLILKLCRTGRSFVSIIYLAFVQGHQWSEGDGRLSNDL